jgi:ribosomal protein S27AE
MSKGRSSWRGGFRVFKVHVDAANRERLKQLFWDFVYGCARVKTVHYYREEWIAEWKNVLEMCKETGKRTAPNPPPIMLLARFIIPDGSVRGDNNAPCVIDLRKEELRIPSYGIQMRLPRRITEALIEENMLEPRPDFIVQITRRGFLRIIARRKLRARLNLPLMVVTIDENSSYGFTIAYWRIDETRASMAGFEKLRPVNHSFRRKVAALLQSYADKPNEETKKQLAEILPPAVLKTLTTERARELAHLTRKREKRLNDEFVNKLVAKVRSVLRETKKRDVGTLIFIDPVNSDSLRGTELQGTLLRARRHLKNLAMYEGAMFRLVRASGKQCPRCGSMGKEVQHTKHSRVYQCPHCGLRWERDKGVHLIMLNNYFKKLRKEESDDNTMIAERILAALKEWLEKYSHILVY